MADASGISDTPGLDFALPADRTLDDDAGAARPLRQSRSPSFCHKTWARKLSAIRRGLEKQMTFLGPASRCHDNGN
jgi:hypothetical protein